MLFGQVPFNAIVRNIRLTDEVCIVMAKDFEACAWPGFWEGIKPVVNFETTTQKLKFSFLQRTEGDFVCVFKTGEEMIEYLDNSPFTEDKYYDSSGHYNWPIQSWQTLALQS